MPPAPERRRVRRVLTAVDAVLIEADGSPVDARLCNLSVVGLRATVSRPLALATRCRVRLRFGEGAIEARGTVVRCEGHDLAMRFDELPYESFQHLRELLLARAEDRRAVEEELDDRLGFLGQD